MAGVEARQSHATDGVSLREVPDGDCIWAHHRYNFDGHWHDLCGSIAGPARNRKDARDDRCWGHSLCKYGALSRPVGSSKCSARHSEPDLPSDVVRERTLDSVAVSSALAPEDCAIPADIPSSTVDAEHLRLWGPDFAGDALERAGGIHDADAGCELGGVQPAGELLGAVHLHPSMRDDSINSRNSALWGYIWLVYSVFYFIDPVLRRDGRFWVESLAIYAVFLAIYIAFTRAKESRTKFILIVALFLLGLLDYPRNQGATSFFIYAAAFLPFLVESVPVVSLLVLTDCLALLAKSVWVMKTTPGQDRLSNPINLGIGMFFVLVVGTIQ